MSRLVVVARDRVAHSLIRSVVRSRRIANLVAVVVVGHIGGHIGLIVAQVLRSRLRVVRRIVVPVVGRLPGLVAILILTVVAIDSRSLDEDRLYDVVGTVDIGRANDLYIGSSVVHLHNEGCHVLIDILRQNSLEHEHVIVSIDSLHHTDVVDPTVAIEVEVRDHVAGRIKDTLELSNRVRLCESRSYGMQIEVETEIARHGRNLYSRGGHRTVVVGLDSRSSGGGLGIYHSRSRRSVDYRRRIGTGRNGCLRHRHNARKTALKRQR